MVKQNAIIAVIRNKLPQPVKNIFKPALEVLPCWHLELQVAFQKYTDNAVSKTINLPEKCFWKDAERIYKTVWQKKAKGITIYRYNPKKTRVMHSSIRSAAEACRVCLG